MSLNRVYKVLRSPVKTVSLGQKQECKHDKKELDVVSEARRRKKDTAILSYVGSVGGKVQRVADWRGVSQAIWAKCATWTDTQYLELSMSRVNHIQHWNQLRLNCNEIVQTRS